jgi:predicted peptidase
MQAKTFEGQYSRRVSLNYLLYLPPEYSTQARWPLILFLHGRGERGSDLELVKLHGLPRRLAAGDHFPFVIAAPQCPAGSYWLEELDALESLLDHLIDQYAIDPRRVYLTGMSMGGRGTWHLAARCPQRFAAIAPICGVGNNWIAQERLSTMPIWVFHGDADSVTPVEESEKMVRWLREVGGNVRFTAYPGVDHDSWTAAYNTPELYTWFLSHSLQ